MTAETFKIKSSYIKLNLVFCGIASFYPCPVEKSPQNPKYIADENSLFSE